MTNNNLQTIFTKKLTHLYEVFLMKCDFQAEYGIACSVNVTTAAKSWAIVCVPSMDSTSTWKKLSLENQCYTVAA